MAEKRTGVGAGQPRELGPAESVFLKQISVQFKVGWNGMCEVRLHCQHGADFKKRAGPYKELK